MTAVLNDTDIYGAVQHFYAKQMQALDSGEFTDYARPSPRTARSSTHQGPSRR